MSSLKERLGFKTFTNPNEKFINIPITRKSSYSSLFTSPKKFEPSSRSGAYIKESEDKKSFTFYS